MEEKSMKWISGFWKRIFALFVDTLFLGAIGFVLGLAFESRFVEMGEWGRVVGFVVALTYFGLMNSKVGKGQTLGKRMLGIRVVDASGACISVPRAFARYVIFALPFLFNGVHFTGNPSLSYLIYPLSVIVFGGAISIVYLYLFNRRTRQSLHDLAVGSYVVNAESAREDLQPIWKIHLVFSAAFFVIAAVLPVVTSSVAESQPFKELVSTQQELSAVPGVRVVSVLSRQTTTSLNGAQPQTSTYITANVYVSQPSVQDAEFARKLAELVATNFPDYESKDAVQIVLTYGFDIGIWSQWSSYNHSFKPEELKQAMRSI